MLIKKRIFQTNNPAVLEKTLPAGISLRAARTGGGWVIEAPDDYDARLWNKACKIIENHDAAYEEELHRFEFNGKRWFGNPRGWDRV